MKTYCFDIDGVICSIEKNYSKATPFLEHIKSINKLYSQGHKIVLWTARGSTTGIDWRKITEQQLKCWNVKYHELHFSKPYYDYWIDDKAVNSLPFFTELLDFHIHPKKYPFVNECAKLVTNSDVYGRGGIIKWM